MPPGLRPRPHGDRRGLDGRPGRPMRLRARPGRGMRPGRRRGRHRRSLDRRGGRSRAGWWVRHRGWDRSDRFEAGSEGEAGAVRLALIMPEGEPDHGIVRQSGQRDRPGTRRVSRRRRRRRRRGRRCRRCRCRRCHGRCRRRDRCCRQSLSSSSLSSVAPGVAVASSSSLSSSLSSVAPGVSVASSAPLPPLPWSSVAPAVAVGSAVSSASAVPVGSAVSVGLGGLGRLGGRRGGRRLGGGVVGGADHGRVRLAGRVDDAVSGKGGTGHQEDGHGGHTQASDQSDVGSHRIGSPSGAGRSTGLLPP